MPDMNMIMQPRPNMMAYGDAMLDGNSPFSMEEALAKQQATGVDPGQEDANKQVLEQLKAKMETLGNSNKVKEYALKLMEEMQKAQELEARMEQHPEIVDFIDQILQQDEQGGQPPVEQLQGAQ